MSQPDFERAKQYVVQRLQALPAQLSYHAIQHTLEDVLPAAERLAEMEALSEAERLLLRTAVLFHDLGFLEHYIGHEAISVRLAQEALPGFGYSPQDIAVIVGIIGATRLPQTPHTPLEQIMADADLDVIGRKDFFIVNQSLRQEHTTQGRHYSDIEWYGSQLKFIQTHAYFTASARQLRDAQKARNIEQMSRLLTYSYQEANMPSSVLSQSNDPDMILSLPERIAILRSVSLFADTPDEILIDVAALLTPVHLEPQQTVINKGDRGDSMFIIVRGHILVHDGEMELSHLGPADVFGEMALLDEQPRVASATATQHTQLLRLDQSTFYALIEQRGEVARGVIRVLNRHLRGRVRDMAEDFSYIQQVGKITQAAAALEAGMYDSAILDGVGERTDELGQLARVFQRMADEIQAREQRLKNEVQMLRIQIDEVKKAQQVAEITESEYFQQLQTKVQNIKKGRSR